MVPAELSNTENAICLCISFMDQGSLCSVILACYHHTFNGPKVKHDLHACVFIIFLQVLYNTASYSTREACCVMASFHLSRWLIVKIIKRIESVADGFCQQCVCGEADLTTLFLGGCYIKTAAEVLSFERVDLPLLWMEMGSQLCQKDDSKRNWSAAEGFHQKCQSLQKMLGDNCQWE